MTRSRLRGKSGVTYQAGQGLIAATVPTAKVVTVGDAKNTIDSSTILAQYPELREEGRVCVRDDTCAGNSTELFTVPAGKYWRLLSLVTILITDATVANRAVTVTTRTVADATIELITHADVAASNAGAQRSTIFGTNKLSGGSRGVAAAGTLTIAEPVDVGDTMVVGSRTYNFALANTHVANQITIVTGGTEAATKIAIAAELESIHPDVTGPSAFTGDGYVITARDKGITDGTDIVTTQAITHASNIFDAATLGTTTAGVDYGDKMSTLNWPSAGVLLTPGEDMILAVTNGVAGDTLTSFLTYLEFDNNPVA